MGMREGELAADRAVFTNRVTRDRFIDHEGWAETPSSFRGGVGAIIDSSNISCRCACPVNLGAIDPNFKNGGRDFELLYFVYGLPLLSRLI